MAEQPPAPKPENTAESEWRGLISSINELTQRGTVKWTVLPPDTIPKHPVGGADEVYETRSLKSPIRLYLWTSQDDAPFLTSPSVQSSGWRTRPVLEVIGDTNWSILRAPEMPITWHLLESVRLQVMRAATTLQELGEALKRLKKDKS